MLAPGDHDLIAFKNAGQGFVYHSDPHHDLSPLLETGIQLPNGGYGFGVLAVGVKGGSQLTAVVDKKDGQFVFDTSGTTGAITKSGYAGYVLTVLRKQGKDISYWVATNEHALVMRRGELAIVDYLHEPATGQKLKVTIGKPGGPYRTQYAYPQALTKSSSG